MVRAGSWVFVISFGLIGACVFSPDLGFETCESDDECWVGCKCLDNSWCVPEKVGRHCEFECDVDEHCDRGQWCFGGSCLQCEADRHCGKYCAECIVRPYNRRCVDGACGCMDDGDCAEEMKCRFGTCVHCFPDCTGICGGAVCPVGQWCDGGVCVECTRDDRCGPVCLDCTGQANNKACLAGECGCNSDADCLEGETCRSGLCTGCNPSCLGRCGGAQDECGGSCLANCPPSQWCPDDKSCTPCHEDTHCGPACLDCTDPNINGARCQKDNQNQYLEDLKIVFYIKLMP